MKKKDWLGLLGVVCLSIVSTSPVVHAAEIVTAEKPDSILNIAKGFGSARLKQTNSGVPYISGRVDGTRYVIYFYGCDDNGKKCDSIMFGSAWVGVKVPLKEINEWNKSKKYAQAFLDDDGDPNINMHVNLDHGVTVENLEDTFNIWTILLKMFKKQVIEA